MAVRMTLRNQEACSVVLGMGQCARRASKSRETVRNRLPLGGLSTNS